MKLGCYITCNMETSSLQHCCDSFCFLHCSDVNGMLLEVRLRQQRGQERSRIKNGVHCSLSHALGPIKTSSIWFLLLSTEMLGIMRHLVAF